MFAIITLLLEVVFLSLINIGAGSQDSISNVTATLLIFFFSFMFFLSVQSDKRLRQYRQSLLVGYFFRIFLLYFDIFGRDIFVLPNSAADSEMFYRNICYYARGLAHRSGSYITMLGTLFRWIGTNRLYGQFINVLPSVIALLFLAYALNELEVPVKHKQRVFLIICLLPNYAILSAIFLRESWVNMFLTISFYFFVRWYTQKQEKSFLLAAVFVFPAAAMHSGSIAVLVGYIVVRFLYDNMQNVLNLRLRNIFIGILLILIAAFVLSKTSSQFLGKFQNLDSIEDIAATGSLGSSSYAQYVGNSSSIINMAIYTLPRIFYFVFSPLPWQWRGLGDVIMFVFSSAVYLIVVWKTIKYLRSGQKEHHAFVASLLIIALATAFVFAWGTSNTGTACRHRDKIITLVAIMWALTSGYEVKQRSKKV